MFNFLKQEQKDFSCTAIIVAAGNSSRMNEYGNKQFIEIYDRPLLSYTIEPFQNCDLVDRIIIVTKDEDIVYCKNQVIDPYDFQKVTNIIAGGVSRQDSVYNGLKEIQNDREVVLIHDGARPLVTLEEIENSIYECLEYGAVTVGVKVKDTIKVIDKDGFVVDTPTRENLWITQTPQVFEYNIIMEAHHNAMNNGYIGTDDATLVEKIGHRIKMIEGSYRNIKVTTYEDLSILKSHLDNN